MPKKTMEMNIIEAAGSVQALADILAEDSSHDEKCSLLSVGQNTLTRWKRWIKRTHPDLLPHAESNVDRTRAAKLSKEVSDLRRQLAASERAKDLVLEHCQEQLAASVQIPSPAASKRSRTKQFLRLIVPDSHGNKIDHEAASAFLGDLKQISSQVEEVVFLGDHLDCDGFLSAHNTLGHTSYDESSFAEDCKAANAFLDAVQKLTPKAKSYHYLEGNHEVRIERWIANNVAEHGPDFRMIYGFLGPENVLQMKKRNIQFYRFYEFHQGLKIQGVIRLGSCHFLHGKTTCKHAADKHLQLVGGNVVYGHTHRIDQAFGRTVAASAMTAASPGCLCKLQPMYQHSNVSQWGHGWGLQVVNRDDGNFQHYNIPIIDGVSMMPRLAR